MKEIWTDTAEKILREFNALKKHAIPLYLFQKNAPQHTINVSAIQTHESGSLVICQKNIDFSLSPESFFVYYQPPQGQLMRFFDGKNIKESRDRLVFPLPSVIFEIQRRKHPRISTPGSSRATFFISGKQQLHNCRVLNVSQEGARIIGKFSKGLQKGDLLSPLTLILCMRYSDLREKIHIEKATVAWVTENGPDERKMGVSFVPEDSDQKSLSHYLHMRFIEQHTP